MLPIVGSMLSAFATAAAAQQPVAWSQAMNWIPGPLMLHALAYDSHRGVTVLFGGASVDEAIVTPRDQTWEWNGSTWSLVQSGHPSRVTAMRWRLTRRAA